MPEGWATADDISAFGNATTHSLPVPEATALSVGGASAAIGGLKGQAVVYATNEDKVEVSIAVEEPVTDAAWAEDKIAFATGQGSVKVFQEGNQVASLSEHAGAATALSLHPSGTILASVGTDKSIVFYDLASQKRVSRAYTDAGKFLRPDSSFAWYVLTISQLLHRARSIPMAISSLLAQPPVTSSSS